MEYPIESKLKTLTFPLAPVQRKVELEELSEHQQNLIKNKKCSFTKVDKLILDLNDKNVYTVYYPLLVFYLKMGMKLKKIHSAIKFQQSNDLSKYIYYNTNKRIEAARLKRWF